jgi:3-oxoacyl-[acyl-carrier-protein] synthase-3
MKSVGIKGVGMYVPKKVLTNQDLEKMVDTSDEWIMKRVGIRERRIAEKEQAASDLALPASLEAIKEANIQPSDIEAIITATITPDMVFPNTSCLLAKKLGLKDIACFDLSAACSGYIYALEIARQLINGGTYKTILVVASEVLSKITDWQDRNTCVLFGDGAGASVLQEVEEGYGIIKSYLACEGRDDILYLPAGGSGYLHLLRL